MTDTERILTENSTCYTLSCLKGIETVRFLYIRTAIVACYTLSRLKGIETFGNGRRGRYSSEYLLHTFPFEGN